jgi:acyl carrier protein
MPSTFDRLIKILVKSYRVEPSKATPSLRLDELGVDSLGIGLLLFDAEDEFQIRFSEDPGPLQTLADVVRYIDRVIAQRHNADQLTPPLESRL